MKRWQRRLLLVAAAFAALAVALALVAGVWLTRELSAGSVAARIGAAIARDVRIRSLEVHYTPWLRVRLEDLEVGSDMAAEVIEVGPRLVALLEGRFEPARIEVAGARLRLVRGPDGALGLPGGGGPPDAPATDLEVRTLPELEVVSTVVEIVDPSAGPEPHRDWIRLDAVVLDPSILTGEATLEAAVRVGREGEHGALSVDGTIGAGPGPFTGLARLVGVELASLRPHLERFGLEVADSSRLDGELSLRVAAADEFEADVTLRMSGQLANTEVTLGGPIDAAASVTSSRGRIGVRDLAITAERVVAAGREAEQLAVVLGSFDVAAAAQWPRAPFRADAREGRVSFVQAGRPVGASIGSATLEATDDAGIVLDLRLGPDHQPGIATLRVLARSFEPGAPLASTPVEIELRTEPFEPAFLLPVLPEAWDPSAHEARISVTATLAGTLSAGVRGQAGLAVREGALELAGVRLAGVSTLDGTLVLGSGAPALDDGRIVAERVQIGPHEARGVEARGVWKGEVLELSSIDLETYNGPLVLVPGLPAFPLEMHVTRLEQFEASGETSPWPLGGLPWLRTPSQASLIGATGRLVDASSPDEAPVALQIERATLHGFEAGEIATLQLRALLGSPAGTRGTVEIEGRMGPIGDPEPALSGSASARGLDPELLLARIPDRWRVGGAPGTVEFDVEVGRLGGPELEAVVEVALPTGTLEVGPTRWAAPASWSGRVRGAGPALSIRDGRLDVRAVGVGDFEGAELRVDHALAGGTLSLQPIQWRAYQGAWHANGTVTLTDPPAFDLSLAVEGAHADALAAVETDEPIGLSGQASAAGEWLGGDRWLEGVEGSGQVALEGGMLPGSQVMRAVWDALLGRVPGLRQIAVSGAESPRTRLRRADLPFQIGDRRIRFDPLEIATEDYVLRGSGRINQALAIRVRGDVQFTAQGVSNMLRTGGIPQGLREGLRLPSIPVEIQGPWDDLGVRADVSAVPRSALSGIMGLPGRAMQATRGVGGVVRGLGERATGRLRPSPREQEADEALPPDPLPGGSP